MNTFDLSRFLNVWNVVKATIIFFLMMQFTVQVSEMLGIAKIPSLAFVFGSVSVILVAFLRLNPPPTLKDVEVIKKELAEFRHILAVDTPDQARNKIGELLELVAKSEELETIRKQDGAYIKQLESDLKRTQKSENENFTSAKQSVLQIEQLKSELGQIKNSLFVALKNAEDNFNKAERLKNELEQYKTAIDDLTNKNTPYHNLFKSDSPETAWKSFVSGMNPKQNAIDKLLPQSVRNLAKQFETAHVESD